jgi:very-short-patch-repair endonuclease
MSRGKSHLRHLEKLRRLPDREAKLPDQADRSVLDKRTEEARRIHRQQKLEGYGTENRAKLTDGEQGMLVILRGLGWRFNVEHSIGNYIADFYVHQFRMVIEVDGGYHTEYAQRQRDKRRDRWMVWKGYRVVRVTNEQVINNPDAVTQELLSRLEPTNPHVICTRVLPSQASQQRRLIAIHAKLTSRIDRI